MKNLKNILVTLTISFIVVGVFIYTAVSNKKKLKLNTERIINNSFVEIKNNDFEDKYDLIKSYNDSLFLISWKKENKGNLYWFNKKNGKVEKKFDVGKNILISDYYKKDDKFLILNKPKKELISVQNLDYKNNLTYHLDKSISRGLLINDHLKFTAYGDDIAMRFYDYNLNDNSLKEVNNNVFNKEQKNTGVLYDGVLKYSNNQVVLIPYSTNEVLFFDGNFNLKSKMRLITDRTDFKFTEMKNGELMPDPNNLYPNIYSDVSENRLYVLTNEYGSWDTKDKYYIDVYNINTKKYEFSYFISDSNIFPREILVENNLIYVLGKNKLNIYEIK